MCCTALLIVLQCTVSNSLGRDAALVELVRRSALSPASLLLSCLLGVALTLSCIIAAYWARRHFNLTEESFSRINSLCRI